MAHQRQHNSKREAFWRDALARFNGSGLTVRAYCVREGLSEPSFYAWRRMLRQRDALDRSPAFVPLAVRDVLSQADSGQSLEIVIELRGGPRICVLRLPMALPARQVAELVHAIEAAPATTEALT